MISIVIPTYNRSEYLASVIKSYSKQDHLKEIIIVDDHSADDTRDVIKRLEVKYKNITLIEHQLHKGLPAARNSGIKQCQGDFILFGEDDIVFDKNYCSVLLDHMHDTGSDIIAGRLIRLKSQQSEKAALAEASKLRDPLIDYRTFTGNFFKKMEEDTFVPFAHACSLIKKEVFYKLRFDENSFRVNFFREETDFFLRAFNLGFKISFCPHTQIYHFPRKSVLWERAGCHPRSPLKARYWRQINNLVFLYKNKSILRNRLQLNHRTMAIKFLLYSVANATKIQFKK